MLNGFGRTVQADGDYEIGWNKDGKAHGYSKFSFDVGADKDEGLFENNRMMSKKHVKAYDVNELLG